MNKTIGSLMVALVLTGCATDPNTQLSQLQNKVDLIQAKNDQLQTTVNQSAEDLQRVTELNRQLSTSVTASSAFGSDLLPPNAKTGECFSRVLTPAVYRTESTEMLKKAAGYRIEVSPPTYEWVTEKVLVKEASEVAEIVPAKYEWKVERILVAEAHEHLKTISEVYEIKTEKVLVKPAYTTWKKGRGPVEKISNSTGEIMCLVEIPAQYKTITSKVIVTPARIEKEFHDAVYKDIKKRFMVAGPTMVKRTVPAVFKTIKVKRIVIAAQETRIEIPAVYQTVTNKVRVSDSVLEWRSILCETNTTGDVVRNLQRALLAAGYNPGPIDGVIGRETMQAVKAYQQAKGLAVGQLTIETIRSLGISY